jgi:hypothetical protein
MWSIHAHWLSSFSSAGVAPRSLDFHILSSVLDAHQELIGRIALFADKIPGFSEAKNFHIRR